MRGIPLFLVPGAHTYRLIRSWMLSAKELIWNAAIAVVDTSHALQLVMINPHREGERAMGWLKERRGTARKDDYFGGEDREAGECFGGDCDANS
jgi:hypothetical protein